MLLDSCVTYLPGCSPLLGDGRPVGLEALCETDEGFVEPAGRRRWRNTGRRYGGLLRLAPEAHEGAVEGVAEPYLSEGCQVHRGAVAAVMIVVMQDELPTRT